MRSVSILTSLITQQILAAAERQSPFWSSLQTLETGMGLFNKGTRERMVCLSDSRWTQRIPTHNMRAPPGTRCQSANAINDTSPSAEPASLDEETLARVLLVGAERRVTQYRMLKSASADDRILSRRPL